MDEDLVDPLQFFVKCKYMSDNHANSTEKRSSQQNRKKCFYLKSARKSKQSVRRQWRSCTNSKNKSLKTYLPKQNPELVMNFKTSWKWLIVGIDEVRWGNKWMGSSNLGALNKRISRTAGWGLKQIRQQDQTANEHDKTSEH